MTAILILYIEPLGACPRIGIFAQIKAFQKNNPEKKKSLGSTVPSETDKTSKKQGKSGKKAEVIVPTQAFEAFFSGMPIKVDTFMERALACPQPHPERIARGGVDQNPAIECS